MTSKNPSASDAPPSYKTLKVIVIVLGILLVFGFAAMVGTIIYRVANMGDETVSASASMDTSGSELMLPGFGVINVVRPSGSELVGHGYDNGILSLHFRDPEGNDRLVLVDAASGKILGAIIISKP